MRDVLTILCALGCGLIAGFFFAFSAGVMKALGRQPAAHGMAAMQAINVVVINPWFLSVFLGTAVACALAVIGAFVLWPSPAPAYMVAGGICYVVGCFGVTMVCNVPRNNALAAVAPETAEGPKLWASYLSSWTAWNHVRALAAVAAAAFFAVALTRV